MKSTYRGIAYLIALGVVAQASFIALAWFTVFADLEDGAVFTKDSELNLGHTLHGIVGMLVIPLLALVLVGISYLTKVTGASKRAGLVLLAVVVQIALAIVSFSVPAVGPLHGINAIVLLGTALYAARRMTVTEPAAVERPAAGVAVPQQGSASESTTV